MWWSSSGWCRSSTAGWRAAAAAPLRSIRQRTGPRCCFLLPVPNLLLKPVRPARADSFVLRPSRMTSGWKPAINGARLPVSSTIGRVQPAGFGAASVRTVVSCIRGMMQ